MNRLDVQLINLDGSDARLTRATAALQAAGIPFRRLPAFDGRGKRPEDLPLYDPAAAMRSFGRKLTGGEIGCFLSHLEAARQFLQTGATYGLVLEDDAIIPVDASEILMRLLDELDRVSPAAPWWVGNLGETTRRIISPVAEVGPSHRLVRAHYYPLLTTAVIWTRDGASAFLRDCNVISMPVDQFLRHWASRSDKGLALDVPLFPAAGIASELDRDGSRTRLRAGLRERVVKRWLRIKSKLAAIRHRRRAAAARKG